MALDLNNTIFAGNVKVYPDSTNTAEYFTLSQVEEASYISPNNFISIFEDIHSDISASDFDTFRPPGSGPINHLFEIKNRIYAARDTSDGTGCKLYTTTALEDLAQDVAWEEVDLGAEVDFDEGAVEFITLYNKEYLDLDFESATDVSDRLGSNVKSIPTVDAPTLFGEWESASDAIVDDGDSVHAAASRRVDTLNAWESTQKLRITGFNVGEDNPAAAGVVGIEVDVRWALNALSANSEARFDTVELVNVGSTDNKATGATTTASSGTISSYSTDTFGGAADTWNATSLNTSNIYSDDFGVDVIFQVRRTGAASSSQPRAGIVVPWIKISVYFEDGTEEVYFWNGSSDVATADVVRAVYQEGNLEYGSAAGYLSLTNVTNEGNIVADLEIRSKASGAGALLATTVGGTTSTGLLPTSSDIEAEDSFPQYIKANFYIDQDKEAIYGVTGAGHAFVFDGTYFTRIKAPIDAEKDKPRHIAVHNDHLVLGYDSGSILVSVVGEPTNFRGVDGASEWGFGDIITGIQPLKGNALAVFCESSVHTLLGSSLENFTTQVVSASSGAIEYSIVDIGQPIFTDYSGVSTISATEQYGDFNSGKLSNAIGPFIRQRIQDICGCRGNVRDIVCALKVRQNGQYKLFFNDGLILTMTLAEAEGLTPMFTYQNFQYDKEDGEKIRREYVPTATMSTVLDDGKELVMFGTDSGDIYVMGQGTGIIEANGIREYDCFMTFNPFNGGAPHMNMKYNEILIHGKTSGGQELTCSSGVNYLAPTDSTESDSVTMGDMTGPFYIDLRPDRTSTHLPNVTDGFSLKIESTADGNLPHIIQAITFRPTPLSDQDAAPRRYS